MKELSTTDVESLVQNKYQVNPLSLSYIGGGFYGRVFLVKLEEMERWSLISNG